MTVAVDLSGVTRRFGAVAAVDDLDLHLAPGEITALLGPSGCGKTTTLRLIAGFERPDRGSVSIGESVVAGPSVWQRPEQRRIGMMFQQLALFPHLDVAGNVGYGIDRRDRRERVEEMLALVGLEGYEGRYPDQLSGGQAQRVALARALAPRPRVLLLDEPFSSLDVALRAGLRAEVRAILRAEQVTTLLVTHDQDEALSFGDRVAVMFDGRLAQVGSPDELYLEPVSAAVAAFVGDANLLPADVVDGVAESELGRVPVEGGGGRSVVLLRPEELAISLATTGHTVVAAEYYGHDQLLTIRLASGTTVQARVHASQLLDIGAEVAVRPSATKARAFNADWTESGSTSGEETGPAPTEGAL